MSVGRSKITPYKQHCFKTILKENIYKCNCVFKKHEGKEWLPKNPKYYIYDFTSGDMKTKDTSSYIILQTLLDDLERINFKAKFYEKSIRKPPTYKSLKENIHNFIKFIEDKNERNYFLHNIKIHPINFQNDKTLFSKSEGKLGLAYFDSNGIGDFSDWKALSKFSESHKMTDILLNISITQLKRCFWSPAASHNLTLFQLLSTINKNHWWVRTIPKKNNHWKFVMLFATNMSTYLLNKEDFFEANLTDIYNVDRYPGNGLINGCDEFITSKNNKK